MASIRAGNGLTWERGSGRLNEADLFELAACRRSQQVGTALRDGNSLRDGAFRRHQDSSPACLDLPLGSPGTVLPDGVQPRILQEVLVRLAPPCAAVRQDLEQIAALVTGQDTGVGA